MEIWKFEDKKIQAMPEDTLVNSLYLVNSLVNN